MRDNFFRLGFDGGGTKTRAVIINESREILGSGASGSSNPYAVGLGAALDNVESAAEIALLEANLSRENIGGWGLGLGGVCSASESAQVESALRARLGFDAKTGPQIVAVEDVVATWAGAFGGETGAAPRVVCIAGTGVGCWGKNARGAVAQADGVGPLLGDRGSGYWIGEGALRHTARALDGVSAPDELSAAVMQHFGAAEVKALIRIVYAPGFERSNVGELARVVLAHAATPSARDILTRAGDELAATSLAVLRRLSDTGIGGAKIHGEVALIGGILAHAAPVQAAFVARLQQTSPGIAFVSARYEPAIGAALLLASDA